MTELGGSLEQMDFVQLVLLFGFVGAYVLALGAMLGARWRARSGLTAALLAAAFVTRTDPWVHGMLLVAFVVAGIGLFVLATWMLARLVAPRPTPTPPADPPLAPILASRPLPPDARRAARPAPSGGLR